MAINVRFSFAARATLMGLTALVATAVPVNASQPSDWQLFRQAYPYHAQMIVFGPPAPDGSRTIIFSEPPPGITLDDVRSRYRNAIDDLAVRTQQIGYDGWVKDITGTLVPMSPEERQQLVEDASRDFFGTSYKAFALELPAPTASHDTYDVSVSAASLRSWLGLEPASRSWLAAAAHWFGWLVAVVWAVAFVRHRKAAQLVVALLAGVVVYVTFARSPEATAGALSPIHGGEPVQLRTLLNAPPTAGTYFTAERGLVVLVLPRRDALNQSTVALREFALDSDLIVGAVGSPQAVAVIGRERQIPVTLMPPLRTETLLQLAAAGTEELAQSYERTRLFAGRTGSEHDDWAPIHLSSQLHDTEYGSLLNITDQLLKSWSERGEIEYINFHYAKPPNYPFPTGLLEHAGTKKVTYNWNTKGVGYALADDEWDILSFTRTGALPVDYLGDQDARMRDFEDTAYEYFATETRDPNLARVVQYAGAYQIFRHYGIGAEWAPSVRTHKGEDALLPMARGILDKLRETDPSEIFAEGQVSEVPELAEALSELKKIHAVLAEIARDGSEPSLDSIAKALVKPRDIDLESATEDQKLALLLAHAISSNRLVRMWVRPVSGLAAALYVSGEAGDPDGWIRTPSIVISWQTGKHAGQASGGHNVDSRVSRLKVDDSLSPGTVRVSEADGVRTLHHSSHDSAKVHDVVRPFARNQEQPLNDLTTLVETRMRAAQPRAAAMNDGLKLVSNAGGPERGMQASERVLIASRTPWKAGGAIPESHASFIDPLNDGLLLPVVVERNGSQYLISGAGERAVILAGDASSARDAVVALSRRAGDRTVHLHFKGMEADAATGFSRAAEMHAGPRNRLRLRTSVEGRGDSVRLVGELSNGRWRAAQAEVKVVDAPVGAMRRNIDVELRIPNEGATGSLRVRISVAFRESLRITQAFLDRLVAAVKAALESASEVAIDLDVLLASRRIITAIHTEGESVASVRVRVAAQSGELDVVQHNVRPQIFAGE